MSRRAKRFLWPSVVVAAGIAVALARNILLREYVEWQVHRTTGLPLHIDWLYWNPRDGWISARGITLRNPPGFDEPVFARVQEIYVEFDARSLFGRHPHFRQLLFNIDEVHFIRKADGSSNAIRMRGVDAPRERSPNRFRIDSVRLVVGTVYVKDDRRLINRDRAYRLNLDETYRDVTELTAVNRLLLLTILKRAPVDIGLTVDKLADGLELVVGLPLNILRGAAGAAGKAGQWLSD